MDKTFLEILCDVINKTSNINFEVDADKANQWADELREAAIKEFFDWKYLCDSVSYSDTTAYTLGDYLRVGNYITNLDKIRKTIPHEPGDGNYGTNTSLCV